MRGRFTRCRARFTRLLSIGAVCLGLSACSSIPRDSFTEAEQKSAAPMGFEGVRFVFGDEAASRAMRDTVLRQARAPGVRPPALLAISGGGANGAYGAGVLNGWTQACGRPVFSIVTGVSTGALIAPFAFLGSRWDGMLKSFYTSGETSDLLNFLGLRALVSDSLFSGTPLRRLIEAHITDAILAEVAAEHAQGRRLLVGTANLDTEQLVVWDMGAIASRGGPEARRLFNTVLLASASIPGVFPPVLIEARVNGRVLREMHVDGSTVNGFFAVPDTALLMAPVSVRGSIHMIVNGKMGREFEVTRHSLLSVVMRGYDTATKAGWLTSLTTIAAFGQRNGVDAWLSSIPVAARAASLDFSQGGMTELFELGRKRALEGRAWVPLARAVTQADPASPMARMSAGKDCAAWGMAAP